MKKDIPLVSATNLIPAFLYGMAASCGMVVAVNFQSVTLESPELVLMGVSFISGLIWDAVK